MMEVLRNEFFQNLLEHYPKLKDDFVVALYHQDEVSSAYYPIVIHGKEYKPDDYLELFKKFLRDEPNSIEALEILLKRPKELNTDLLDELRRKLTETPEQFSEYHLRRAYGNNLADIIGMIRSAPSTKPLLTTKQRVQNAIQTVSEGRRFSVREKLWLDLIANHLDYNLLIERRHFAYIPFSGKGGWKKANEDFDYRLEQILLKVNEAMTS